jgi:eukaryotic-like serine/threonine-protein kinase
MSKRGASTGAGPDGDGRGSRVTAVDRADDRTNLGHRAPLLASQSAVRDPATPAPLPVPVSARTPTPPVATPTPHLPGQPQPTPSFGLHAAIPTPSAQLVRLGRYQIVERIATGGMAEVYLAVHGELAGFRTPVVLKKVLPHLASNQQFIDMFLDEARIASLLDHPNVVRIYEVGRSGNEYFLAMELVQGKSLSALLRRAQDPERPTPSPIEPRLAALIIAQAAAGLHHAHNLTDPLGNPLGLVHRDVSPQNLLISFEGSVKVIDFGIARALGRISETQTGGMKGKFGYMSPEQARGEEIDLRTDIFALGVVLWEAVTGHRLFNRENDLATMRALVYEPIPKPSSVVAISPELESIIMRALARNPKLRFQTARDMATALERYVVTAGGASNSDLGTLMKSGFAQDHSAWRQTLRTAVNLPAITEADLAGTPSATPGPAPGYHTQTVHVVPRRWPVAVMALALVAGGAVAFAFMAGNRPPDPAPIPAPSASPAAAAPAAAPVVVPPPAVAPVPSPPGAAPVTPGPGTSEDPALDGRPPGKKSTRRRRPAAAEKIPKTSAPDPTKIDRRPNPF